MTSYELALRCYMDSDGTVNGFVSELEKHGFREGFNGYERCGLSDIRVYVGAPDRYAGFHCKAI